MGLRCSLDSKKAAFKGYATTMAAGNTTNFDILIPASTYINGGEVILKNHVDGDTFGYQIVDVDNILGLGAGTVLVTSMENWNANSEFQYQGRFVVDYLDQLTEGLYIRIKYTSTGLNAVTFRLNLFIYKDF